MGAHTDLSTVRSIGAFMTAFDLINWTDVPTEKALQALVNIGINSPMYMSTVGQVCHCAQKLTTRFERKKV